MVREDNVFDFLENRNDSKKSRRVKLQSIRDLYNNSARKGKCWYCGKRRWEVNHHIDSKKKLVAIYLLATGGRGILPKIISDIPNTEDRLKFEIIKTAALCTKCHKEFHKREADLKALQRMIEKFRKIAEDNLCNTRKEDIKDQLNLFDSA